MSGADEDDVTDDFDDEVSESEEQAETVVLSPTDTLEVRRRLEDRLEERRLNKLIQDYDFDF